MCFAKMNTDVYLLFYGIIIVYLHRINKFIDLNNL